MPDSQQHRQRAVRGGGVGRRPAAAVRRHQPEHFRPGAQHQRYCPLPEHDQAVLPATSARCPTRSTPSSWALRAQQRIFDLLDEQPEADDGYVTLVNAARGKRTNRWRMPRAHRRVGLEASRTQRRQRDLHQADGRRAPVRCGLRLRGRTKPCCTTSTLYAEPGQKVAFVGATGAGKTTITNLLNRFYDIADGKIRYDGININKIKKGATCAARSASCCRTPTCSPAR